MDLPYPAKGAIRLLWRSGLLLGFCVPPASAMDGIVEALLGAPQMSVRARRQAGTRGSEKP